MNPSSGLTPHSNASALAPSACQYHDDFMQALIQQRPADVAEVIERVLKPQ